MACGPRSEVSGRRKPGARPSTSSAGSRPAEPRNDSVCAGSGPRRRRARFRRPGRVGTRRDRQRGRREAGRVGADGEREHDTVAAHDQHRGSLAQRLAPRGLGHGGRAVGQGRARVERHPRGRRRKPDEAPVERRTRAARLRCGERQRSLQRRGVGRDHDGPIMLRRDRSPARTRRRRERLRSDPQAPIGEPTAMRPPVSRWTWSALSVAPGNSGINATAIKPAEAWRVSRSSTADVSAGMKANGSIPTGGPGGGRSGPRRRVRAPAPDHGRHDCEQRGTDQQRTSTVSS